MKILMVLTSHEQLGDTAKKTGFWLEEVRSSIPRPYVRRRIDHPCVARRALGACRICAFVIRAS